MKPSIGRLNHVGIAVPDLDAATATYRDVLGAVVSEPVTLPEHGVTLRFVDLPNTRLELLYPYGEDSAVASFLERHKSGGVHHISIEVDDIAAACDRLKEAGIRPLGEPRIGAHGTPVVFVHPGDLYGTLIELQEA